MTQIPTIHFSWNGGRKKVSASRPLKIAFFLRNKASSLLKRGVSIKVKVVYGKWKGKHNKMETVDNQAIFKTEEEFLQGVRAFLDKELWI